MNGFKSHPSCKRFLELLDIMHNFIKPSIALDSGYPAEKAGIKLPLGRIWTPLSSKSQQRCSEMTTKNWKTSNANNQPNSQQYLSVGIDI
ncbi:MAG TPA: hypothetical protein VJZ75_06895 [Candidatus Bathyarchaeia archaeon]|nr:hypothetical protein [Candidatus Bathyarchaeia archaeon]